MTCATSGLRIKLLTWHPRDLSFSPLPSHPKILQNGCFISMGLELRWWWYWEEPGADSLWKINFYCFKPLKKTKNTALNFPRCNKSLCIRLSSWASLVGQWLRICLPVQGTRVRALVREDPTCRGATRPVSRNCWACASGACAPQQERPR